MKRSSSNKPSKNQPSYSIIRKIFAGVLYSIILSITLSAILAVIYLNSNSIINEFIDRFTAYIVFAISLISIFCSSILIVRKNHSKTLIIGLAIGGLYTIFISVIGYQFFHDSFVFSVFANKFLAGVAAGGLGSLVGVNL